MASALNRNGNSQLAELVKALTSELDEFPREVCEEPVWLERLVRNLYCLQQVLTIFWVFLAEDLYRLLIMQLLEYFLPMVWCTYLKIICPIDSGIESRVGP